MTIALPSYDDIKGLVRPYLNPDQRFAPSGFRLGFVVGIASPDYQSGPKGRLFFFGNSTDRSQRPLLYDQNMQEMVLDGTTVFEIASVTKTFTGTLLNVNLADA
jgi:hypothetical protein